MVKQFVEHQPTIYRPEDIKFRNGEPYLTILLGQMALELVLRNVGSSQEPIWIAWFDPREEEVRSAGTAALVEILNKISGLSIALTPYSSKSGPMIEQACRKSGLPIFTLPGGRDLEQLQEQVGFDEKIYSYHPITSQEKPKHLAFGQEIRADIKSMIMLNKGIVIIDDVYSSGNTIKTILEGLKSFLSEELYQDAQIEVVTVAREGVIHNGDLVPEVDLDRPLTFDVFIPEVIGDLKKAISH